MYQHEPDSYNFMARSNARKHYIKHRKDLQLSSIQYHHSMVLALLHKFSYKILAFRMYDIQEGKSVKQHY